MAANYIVEELAAKKIAIFHDDGSYGIKLSQAMRSQLHKLGIKEIIYQKLNPDQSDIKKLTKEIKLNKADVVYFGGSYSLGGGLLKEMRTQGLSATFMSGDGIVSQEFVKSAGGKPSLEGVLMTWNVNYTLPLDKTTSDKLSRNGSNPESYTLSTYASLQVISQAIKGSKSIDSNKISSWLKKHEINTVIGMKSFDKKGDLKTSNYAMYEWNNQGSFGEL